MFEYFQKFDFTSTSDYVLILHLLTLVFVAFNVLMADHMGFSWMSGKVQLLDENTVRKYHIRVSIGLGLMIATGLVMFWPMREYLLERVQFFVKMGFVTALVINSFVINHFSRIPITRTYESLSLKEKLSMIISGGISALCWLGAFVGAFYIVESF